MSDYKLVPVDLLSELAESLACELDARYPASVRSYESQDRKYMAEMEPVLTARQIIAAAPAVQGEPVFMWHRGATDDESEVVDVDCACPCCVPLYAAPQPAEQQPAPDVAALVESLETIRKAATHESIHTGIQAGTALGYIAAICDVALAAHRGQGGEV